MSFFSLRLFLPKQTPYWGFFILANTNFDVRKRLDVPKIVNFSYVGHFAAHMGPHIFLESKYRFSVFENFSPNKHPNGGFSARRTQTGWCLKKSLEAPKIVNLTYLCAFSG